MQSSFLFYTFPSTLSPPLTPFSPFVPRGFRLGRCSLGYERARLLRAKSSYHITRGTSRGRRRYWSPGRYECCWMDRSSLAWHCTAVRSTVPYELCACVLRRANGYSAGCYVMCCWIVRVLVSLHSPSLLHPLPFFLNPSVLCLSLSLPTLGLFSSSSISISSPRRTSGLRPPSNHPDRSRSAPALVCRL